ncbi:adenylyltransferase/cytidyltransferase family protein [Patescibacteria group bacterium]|nr:adenylyltransferase/cytidyltransferase family protein [Patescibacteria group bacterium]
MENKKKVYPIDELATQIEALRKDGKRIVQCHGCFDLLHAGHLKHFETAKKEGDILVVTVTSDRFVNKGPGRPVFPHQIRAETLAALDLVDFVAVCDSPSAVHAIELLRPDVYVKGKNYADKCNDVTTNTFEEKQAVEQYGGRMFFTLETVFGSSSLLNQYFELYPREVQLFLEDFRKRYSAEDVLRALEGIRGLKVLVVGDAVVDEYHYVSPMGRTSKSNIVASRFLSDESFAGGIFACANHVAGFCDDVHLVTCLGLRDTKEGYIRQNLKSNVKTSFVYRSDCPTTVKRRYVDRLNLSKLFEVYFFEDAPMPDETEDQLVATLEKLLPEYDVVISLDYAHGFLSQRTINLIVERSKFLAVNTQTNAANIGYNPVVKYPRADYVCIDEPELRLATRDRFGAIEPLLTSVVEKLQSPKGVVTRGHNGCLVTEAGKGLTHIPVMSQKIVDTVGAGDAFLAITAPCVASGLPMELVGFIGNAVGAKAVTIVGNRESVEPIPLIQTIKAIMA